MATNDKEAPEQSYYPMAKVRLVLRFEEFGNAKVVADKAPKKLAHTMRGTKSSRGALEVKQDPDAPAGVKRLIVVPLSGQAESPQQEDRSADDLSWSIGGIVPKTASHKKNGIRTASELKLTLKFVDVPFDPRAIRTCAVEYYLGTVRQDDFEAAMVGSDRSLADKSPGAAGGLMLPDTWVDALGRVRKNLRFQGWVDDWEVDWNEDDEPIATLTCRDNTKVLIDQDAPPKLVVAANKPVDEAFAAYLSNFPHFAGMSVEYRPGGVPVPKLGDALSKTSYRPNLGPVPTKAGGTPAKMSVWDYFTDVCGAIGHIVRVEGTAVVIQRARTLMSNEAVQREEDPFTKRVVPGGLEMTRRHFIYGRNVLSYKVARRYSKSAPTNVEVRSYSTKRKKVLIARFPVSPVVTTANPGDGHSEKKYLVWRVSGIEDEKTLRVVAQSVYETVGRNELMVSLKTQNLASFGGGNEDPDVLDMEQGDPFEILVSRDSDYSTLTQIEQDMLVAERGRSLLEVAGYSSDLANAYSKAFTDAGFQTTFRLRDFGTDWSIDDGVSLSVGGVNYVEVRMDQELPVGEEQKGKSKGDKKQQPKGT